jgi:hypothetical protein
MSESTRSNLIKAMAAVDAADAVEDQIKAEADEFFESGKPQHPKAPNPQAISDESALCRRLRLPFSQAYLLMRADALGSKATSPAALLDETSIAEMDMLRLMVERARGVQ